MKKKRIRKDRAARRAQILETAARIFCEKGFDKASMEDIASATGLTKAGLYHHIGSKEELLYAIMAYGMDLFEEMVLDRVKHSRRCDRSRRRECRYREGLNSRLGWTRCTCRS